MKLFKFYLVGIMFGIALAKAEIISWYRIQEMFRFQSFHMYGVIGSAVIIGIIAVQIIKRTRIKDAAGKTYYFPNKDKKFWKYILGGSIFGLGWALTGSCPGPMYILLGYGYFSFSIVIVSALLGTFVYGVLKKYLPH